jgi:hypothetical protein
MKSAAEGVQPDLARRAGGFKQHDEAVADAKPFQKG